MNSIFPIVLLIASQAAASVRVTTVDDRAVEGTIGTWDAAGVEVTTPRGATQQIALEDVLRIDFPRGGTSGLPTGEIVLTDGTRLAVSEYSTGDQRAHFRGPTRELDSHLDAVRSVRLMPLPTDATSIANEWRNLLAMEPTGDLIVIRKPGASNLNFVEGTLGDVTPETVEFTLDGEKLEVNRAKVFGLIYYRDPSNDGDSQPTAIVSGAGIRLPARGMILADETLEIETLHLGTIRLPLSAVAAVDYSIDRLQYLSDFEPTRFAFEPAAGTAPSSSLFSSIARDRAFHAPSSRWNTRPNRSRPSKWVRRDFLGG